ncbi:discoidin domain-containing protein [uncultured Sphingomonas sp.]|uniref:discoidin domain-containing protein n=1 Tax=uncultured Sphingomonas sp. TaxID=158754 RepID=UPI0025FAD944|nr:discoidin domain-containing protein [uncultured Sphingomonas sp.]
MTEIISATVLGLRGPGLTGDDREQLDEALAAAADLTGLRFGGSTGWPRGSHRFWRVVITQLNGGLQLASLEFRNVPGTPRQATGGTPIENAHTGGFGPANAFDGDITTTWVGADPAPYYLGYDFGTATEVNEVAIVAANAGPEKAPRSFTVQFSDDGSTWSDAWSVMDQTGWQVSEERAFTDSSYGLERAYPVYANEDGTALYQRDRNGFHAVEVTGGEPINPRGAHRYWRMLVTVINAGLQLGELEFRAIPGVSQRATGGAPIENAHTGSFGPANAFDGNPDTAWVGADPAPFYLGYVFASAVEVNELAIIATTTSSEKAPNSFTIQFSDDGTNWTNAWTVAGQTGWASNEARAFPDPDYVEPEGSRALNRFRGSREIGTYTVAPATPAPAVTLSGPRAGPSISGAKFLPATDPAFRTMYATPALWAPSNDIYDSAGHRYAGVTYPSGSLASNASERFVHSGRSLELAFWSAVTTFQVLADGAPVTGLITLPNDGDRRWLLIDFGSSKTRLIQLICEGNTRFLGVAYESSGSIAADDYRPLRVGIQADSWGEGPYGGRGLPSSFVRAGLRLGIDLHALAVGGTGFLAAPGGTKTYRQRLADLTGMPALDVGGWMMSQNDALSTVTDLRAEMITTFEAYRAALLSTPAVLIGPAAPQTDANGNPPAWVMRHRDVGADLASHYGFAWIDRIDWIKGDGRTGAPTGHGNSDLYIGGADGTDSQHLNYLDGIDYYSRRIANALAPALNDMLSY